MIDAALHLHSVGPAFLPDLTPWIQPAIFVGLAALTIVSAVLAAVAPRIVHAAFALMGTFLGVAGLYALLGADFIALTQVIVYVGGILILLVFGILLTGRVQSALGLLKRPRLLYPVLAGGLVLFGLLLAISSTNWHANPQPSDPQPTTAEIGRALLDPQRFLVPFELASVLLLAALIGAAYLVRRRRDS
jgi:NAD(P)H-quinone oxidoreductase subunit 6